MCTTNNEKEDELILAEVMVLTLGLRSNELLNIKYADISNDCLRLSYSKKVASNQLVRHTIPLSNALQLKIKKHQLAFFQNEYVFNELRKNSYVLKTKHWRQEYLKQFFTKMDTNVCHLNNSVSVSKECYLNNGVGA
tara:strand:+ start:972 stop:1382 length:411 start_codon:yes stop_codon:yes gene_type:complete